MRGSLGGATPKEKNVVWSVEREEMPDGMAVYVESGTTRELYYRKSLGGSRHSNHPGVARES